MKRQSPSSYIMVYDDETDAFQYNSIATLSKGVNEEVMGAIHKVIKVGEKIPLQSLAEKVKDTDTDIKYTVKTIYEHIDKMAKKMVPVCNEEGEIIGYLLKEVEKGKEKGMWHI